MTFNDSGGAQAVPPTQAPSTVSRVPREGPPDTHGDPQGSSASRKMGEMGSSPPDKDREAGLKSRERGCGHSQGQHAGLVGIIVPGGHTLPLGGTLGCSAHAWVDRAVCAGQWDASRHFGRRRLQVFAQVV